MESGTPFAKSLQIQVRVIGALLMREIITRYGRHNIGFLWLFLEPMLFTLGVTGLWYAIGLHHTFSSIPVVAFALTGYSSVLLWRNCASRCSMAILPNVPLLYHRNVRVLDVLITRILLEIAGASISFMMLSALWTSLGWMEPPADVLLILYGWLLLAWFGTALALIIGALTAYDEIAERIWQPAAYLFFPISGAAFMVDWLPSNLQSIVLLIPMVHGTEMLREGYFGTVARTHYDEFYLIGTSLAFTLIGLALVRDASRRVEFL